MNDETQQITCATYTHARRHPVVLGQIGGWTPPFQLTLSQLAILFVCYLVEYQTWQWWAPVLPRMVALVVAVCGPGLLAHAARHTRLEGRSLPRTALGWLQLAWTPRTGQIDGRRCRAPQATSTAHIWLYVARGDLARGDERR